MLKSLGGWLVSRGANPNTGAFHGACARAVVMSRDRKDVLEGEWLWDWARDLGLDFSRFAGKAFRELNARGEAAMELLESWRARGIEPSAIDRRDPDAPLHQMFERDNPELGWRMVELGAPADAVDAAGETIVHVLSKTHSRSKDLAKALARPEVLALIESARVEGGERALHLACAAQSMASIKLLLEHGADANARDAKGWTPLRHLLRKFGAGAQKKAEPMLRLLLDHGADPSIKDAKGMTPAQARAGKAPIAALEKLLELRPQDIAGDGEEALAAKQKLKGRGGQGASLAERVEIKEALSDPEPAKKARRGL